MPAVSFCPGIRTRLAWRASAKAKRRWFGVVAALIINIGVYPSPEPAIAQSQPVDLSLQPVGSALQDFEFWRAGEPDENHWSIVREGSKENSPSIQQSGANRAAGPTLAIYKPRWSVNGMIRAQFKLIDGSMPSAGIAVRVSSPNDYYVSAGQRI